MQRKVKKNNNKRKLLYWGLLCWYENSASSDGSITAWSAFTDTDVIETKSSGLTSEVTALQKIVKFLENMNKDEKVTEDTMAFSYRLDKFVFCFFVFIYILYVIILICITRTDICKVNNLDFWDNSKHEDDNYDYSYNP